MNAKLGAIARLGKGEGKKAGASFCNTELQKGLDRRCFCSYINPVDITFDPAKRDATLAERGLDFADAAIVLAGQTFRFQDVRANYGETRMIAVGMLRGRMVVLVYTDRPSGRHIISMRKANDREQQRYQRELGRSG